MINGKIFCKSGPSFLLCAFFSARQNLVNSFTYIKESVSYNYVYLILACVKNSVFSNENETINTSR